MCIFLLLIHLSSYQLFEKWPTSDSCVIDKNYVDSQTLTISPQHGCKTQNPSYLVMFESLQYRYYSLTFLIVISTLLRYEYYSLFNGASLMEYSLYRSYSVWTLIRKRNLIKGILPLLRKCPFNKTKDIYSCLNRNQTTGSKWLCLRSRIDQITEV